MNDTLTDTDWLHAAVDTLLCGEWRIADRDRAAFVAVQRGALVPGIGAKLARYRAALKERGIAWRDIGATNGMDGVDEAVRSERWVDMVKDPLGRLPKFGISCAGRDISGMAAMGLIGGSASLRTLPTTLASVRTIAALVKVHGFQMTDAARALAAEIQSHARDTEEASRAATGDFTVEGASEQPWPYQQAGIAFLVAQKKCILGDDMGLGKTLEALMAVQALGAWPCGVVCPASVKLGWKEQAEKWLPGVKVVVWNGREGEVPEAHGEIAGVDGEPERVLHVVNYDLLPSVRGQAGRLEEWKKLGLQSVIFDEAHALKNGRSKRTLACRELARRKKVRFLLTGTVVENAPQELLPLLSACGRLDDLGGFDFFTQRYCEAQMRQFSRGKVGWDMGGAANLDELHQKLRATGIYLRRTKEEVLPELPPKITARVPVTMSAEGAKRYHEAKADIGAWLASKAACDAAWQSTIAHLDADAREAARLARYEEAIRRLDGMELLHRLQTLLSVCAEAKLPQAVEWARGAMEQGKIVLFAHHKTVVRGLHAELGKDGAAEVIDGAVTGPQRAEAVRRFREDAACRAMILSINAGSTGLDGLQHASSTVAWLERPWTPGKMNQGGDRLRRIGQRSTVHEYHLIAPGTADDEQWAILRAKREIAEAVIDGEQVKLAAMDAARSVALRISH